MVILQTMREYSWKSERFWVMLPDCIFIVLAEMFVDWIKHAFITRFNELNLDVYRDYTTSLAYDVAQTRQKHAFSDHCDLVARRMGFIPLPLGVVIIRVLFDCVNIEDLASIVILFFVFLFLTSLKVLNSLLILARACYLISQHKMDKSLNSPNNNRCNSPLVTRSRTDTATSPLHPIVDQPTLRPTMLFQEIDDKKDEKRDAPPIPKDLVEGDDIKIETLTEDVTRSVPNIKSELPEDVIPQDSITEDTFKRSESEPNLNKIENEN
ncbi:protein TAPT1 homolog [Diabrotica undecimpunctata]|uniref:protein TAPT1 homolog n=1 Tax=Diabrotica undecimpunctata TaxID=50387 RepID=UPI003B63E612